MKKSVILLPCLLFCLLHASRQEVFGRSYMLTRPASYNIAMDQHLWHNVVYSKGGPWYGGIQFIPFYQRSQKISKTARYFLFDGKNELLISGDATNEVLKRDIRAEWLNLPTDFHGKISINPEQEQRGFTLMYNQDIKGLFDFEFLGDWSIGIEIPVIRVNNSINFCQYDMSTTGTEQNTQSDPFHAFNQTSWNYARIPTRSQCLLRPEKLKFTVGRAMMSQDYFLFASFLSLSIPLAPHHDPAFLFSPTVGLDHHIGYGGGVLIQAPLNKNTDTYALTIFTQLDGTFFFRNSQFRTYDLREKPWSRYMLFTRRDSAPGETVPGVNVLTLDSTVRPFGVADFSVGCRIYARAIEAEVGYGIWGFGGERLELRSELNSVFNNPCRGLNEFGIAGTGTIDVHGQSSQATASASTIAQKAPDDATFVGITSEDIDFKSAAAGSVLNHKFHAAIGIQNFANRMNGFAGVGMFLEFPQKNASLKTWGLWLKAGGTF